MKRVGIIGCGWLGKPLALHLRDAHDVRCYSRKTPEDTLLNHSINPNPEDPFYTSEIFIISITTKDNYVQTIEKIVSNCPSGSRIILISSTSVYKEFDAEVDEESVITQRSVQKEAEECVLSLRENVLILRLGGLMGDDRISGKWKSTLAFTDGPVNYIHKDDVINIISKIIKEDITQGLFNLVAPKHPLRSQVHEHNAKAFGFERGNFKGESKRIVSSEKLIKRLSYQFIHPDPLLFWT